MPAIATVLFLLLMTAACGSPEQDGSAPGGTSEAEQTAPEERGTAELPPNFPQDFPMPSDLRISEAEFTEGDAMTQPNFLVRGTSTQRIAELATFYNERLPPAGYRVIQSANPSPDAANALVYFEGEAVRDASVQLNAAGEETDVLISLPLRD